MPSPTYDDPLMRTVVRAFVLAERETLFPAQVGVAMSALESGWWKKPSGSYNYFNITRPPKFPGDSDSAFCWTKEYITVKQLQKFREDERATASIEIQGTNPEGPHWYRMQRWFAAYPTAKDAVVAYINLITKVERYKPAWTKFLDNRKLDYDRACESLIRDIAAAGYATGPTAETEIKIMNQKNVKFAVSQARKDLA